MEITDKLVAYVAELAHLKLDDEQRQQAADDLARMIGYVDKLGDEEPCTDPGAYLPNRYPHASYAAMVTHIDRQVGQLVEKLKELGVWENTIFIVSSDNGPAHNGNSPMEYFNSGGPFRCSAGWGKSSLREGGIRMPFIVCRGGKVQGRSVSRISSFADIMPTLAELAGVEAPENDGISIAPTIMDRPRRQRDHEALYWEFPGGKGWVAVRMGDWKGLLRNVKKGNAEMELYNLAEDPQETTDLAAEHPEIISEMWRVIRSSHEAANPEVKKFNMEIPDPEL